MTDQTIRNQTVFLALSGSRAHGTSNDASDIDVMGVALPTREQLLTVFQKFDQENRADKLACFASDLPASEQNVVKRSKLEGTVYGLQKYLNLATMANPNIIENLFCRDNEVRLITELGEQLRAHRELFVTSKCRHTFGGYAINQLGRIRRHYRWHHNGPDGPPLRSEYDLPAMSLVSKADVDAAESAIQKQLDSWELDLSEVEPAVRIDVENRIVTTLVEWNLSASSDKHNAAARWIGLDDNLIEIIQQERRWRMANDEWQKYRRWKENRNPERAKLEEKFGYDTKHGSHLVRLLRMGVEIVSTGEVHVWRGDIDADELRAIRDGMWTYETLCEWADQAHAQLMQTESVLSAHTDRDQIDKLCMHLLEQAITTEKLA